MRALEHPDTTSKPQDGLNFGSEDASSGASSPSSKTALPLHWYLFFGIIEPISVAAGSVYAIFFQQRYHAELIPLGYIVSLSHNGATTASSISTSLLEALWPSAQSSTQLSGSARAAAAAAFSKADILGPPTRMALSQLGSCYFLIMLNSALVFYALRRHVSHMPEAQERILYYFFFVLGAADWTHILLTIHFLPSVGSPAFAGTSAAAVLGNNIVGFVAKMSVLVRYPSAWNSLLFGNIAITLMLFMARAAWWIGLGRDSFVHVSSSSSKRGSLSSKPLPLPPKTPSKKTQ